MGRKGCGDRDSDEDDDRDGNEGDDGDGDEDNMGKTGKCVDGEDIIFVDSLCDDDYTGSDPTTDGFLADICVTYNVREINPNADCGRMRSLFLGLCTNDDTDFDPDTLGIGDISNIISEYSDGTLIGNNVEDASGGRNDDGDLGITVVLEDPNADSFTLCFDNVIVTTSFNRIKDDLDVAEGTINYSNFKKCDSVGLPCLTFFFGCDDYLTGTRQDASNVEFNELLDSSNSLDSFDVNLKNKNPMKIWNEMNPLIQWMLICLIFSIGLVIAVSCYICGFRNRLRQKPFSMNDVLDVNSDESESEDDIEIAMLRDREY